MKAQNCYPIQIRFCDLDSLGHINHAVFVSYLEAARVLWLQDLKLEGFHKLDQIPIILARLEVDYLQPAFMESKLHVELNVGHIGTKSFHLDYVIKEKESIIAKAKTIQVWYDYQKKQPVPIPNSAKKLFATLT